MQIPTRAILLSILSSGTILGIEGCSPKATPAVTVAPPAQQYSLTATVQDLMDGFIDPSADALWDSVAFIATRSGSEDRRPRTDGQWKAVRTSAVTLIEAANLLSMPGRRVAADLPDSPRHPGRVN